MPKAPVNVDSSPMIDILNKALKALNATDRDYDGHREKAINHVETAIHKLQVPTANANAKGKGNGANAKADTGKTPPRPTPATLPPRPRRPLRTNRTPACARRKRCSSTSHHKLTDKASTAGRIHADADVRVAIDEVTLALKNSAPAPSPAAAPASPAAPKANIK